MVRNYIRKTIDTYYPESLQKAVQKVKNKELSVRKAASVYGVPRSTLFSRITGKHGFKSDTRGRPTRFSSSFEKNMADVLHSMERCGFSLTKREVTGLVSHYATRNNITTKFKNNLPGQDWFSAFTKRHKLTLKKIHRSESARKVDPFVIYGFYELLQEAVSRFGIKSNRIYCLSENVFNIDPKKETVNIHTYCSKTISRGENATVFIAANALGEKITPLIITKETTLWNNWLYNKEPSQKTRINPRVFENYFDNVVFPMLCSNKDPLLIIYDGRSTHLDIQVLKMAAKHNITVIKLPPNISQLHPIDMNVKSEMKSNLENHLMNWKLENIGKLGDDELSCFITEAWYEIDPNIIMEGFKKGGIWPVDCKKFPREIFNRTALTDWEEYERNEHRVIKEPFLPKTKTLKSKNDDENGTIHRIDMEIDSDEVVSRNDEDDELSNGSENEFKPNYQEIVSHIDISKLTNGKNQRLRQNETIADVDPLSEPSLSNGFADLTNAINNLCGELVSVRKEMVSFKKQLVKMTTTMTEFNKRVSDVERKLPS